MWEMSCRLSRPQAPLQLLWPQQWGRGRIWLYTRPYSLLTKKYGCLFCSAYTGPSCGDYGMRCIAKHALWWMQTRSRLRQKLQSISRKRFRFNWVNVGQSVRAGSSQCRTVVSDCVVFLSMLREQTPGPGIPRPGRMSIWLRRRSLPSLKCVYHWDAFTWTRVLLHQAWSALQTRTGFGPSMTGKYISTQHSTHAPPLVPNALTHNESSTAKYRGSVPPWCHLLRGVF